MSLLFKEVEGSHSLTQSIANLNHSHPESNLIAGTVSISTLATLSIHRLMTVKNNPKWKIATYTKAFVIIIGIWVYTLAISLPPFFGFGAFVPETSGLT